MTIKRSVSILRMMDITVVGMIFDEIQKLTGAQMELIRLTSLDRKRAILYARAKKIPSLCIWQCKQSTDHSVSLATIPICRVFVEIHLCSILDYKLIFIFITTFTLLEV